jgi:cell division inhibitor SepF
MASGFLKRGMNYLGLIDDEDGAPMPMDHPDSSLVSDGWSEEEGPSPAMRADTVQPHALEPTSTVSLLTPGRMRTSAELSPHVYTVAPTEFADARQIADHVMAGQPVVINLQTASRELKRRMIDFCSGVTYSLGGGMERIAGNIFLIMPSDVELSADERKWA